VTEPPSWAGSGPIYARRGPTRAICGVNRPSKSVIPPLSPNPPEDALGENSVIPASLTDGPLSSGPRRQLSIYRRPVLPYSVSSALGGVAGHTSGWRSVPLMFDLAWSCPYRRQFHSAPRSLSALPGSGGRSVLNPRRRRQTQGEASVRRSRTRGRRLGRPLRCSSSSTPTPESSHRHSPRSIRSPSCLAHDRIR